MAHENSRCDQINCPVCGEADRLAKECEEFGRLLNEAMAQFREIEPDGFDFGWSCEPGDDGGLEANVTFDFEMSDPNAYGLMQELGAALIGLKEMVKSEGDRASERARNPLRAHCRRLNEAS